MDRLLFEYTKAKYRLDRSTALERRYWKNRFHFIQEILKEQDIQPPPTLLDPIRGLYIYDKTN